MNVVRKLLAAIGVAALLLLLLLFSGVADAIFDPLLNPLRDYLVKTATGYVSKSLHGTLEVGALRGSLLSAPVLHNIVLRNDHGEVIGQIDELRLAYSLTSLFRWRLTINAIEIVRPHLTLVQEPDGRLNFSRLRVEAPPDSVSQPKEPSSGFGLPIGVMLERLQVRDGRIDLRLPSLPAVQTVDGLQVQVRAQLDREKVRAELRQFTARTTPADVTIQTLQGAFQTSAGVTQIDDFRLQMDNTVLTADGVLPGSKQPASFGLQLQPLDMTDIARLLQDNTLQGEIHLRLKAEGPPEALVVSSQITTPKGRIDLHSEANTVAMPRRYRAQLDIAKLDVSALVHRATLQSDLNLQMNVSGQGLSLAELQSDIQLAIEPSHFGTITLHPSEMHLEAQRRRFQVHRLDLNTSVARLTASGALDLAGSSDLQYELAAALGDLREMLNVNALDGKVHLRGQANGEWPALNTHGALDVSGVRYQDNRLQSLRLTYEGSELGAQPSIVAHLHIDQVQAGTLPIDQVALALTYQGVERRARFATEVIQAPAHSAKLHGALTLTETGQQVEVEELVVHLPDRTWQAPAPLQIVHEHQRLELRQVRLVHADESIEISGAIDGERLEGLRLHIAQLDLSYLRRLLHLPEPVAGRTTLQLQLTGTMAEPRLQGELALQPEARQPHPFEQFHTTLAYADKQFSTAVRLQQANGEVLTLDLQLPIDMAFTALPLAQRLLDSPLELRLQLKQPNLAVLQSLQPSLPKLAGTLQGTLGVQGTYAALALNANLQLEQLGIVGTAEQISAPISLTARLVTASSVQELVSALERGQLTPTLQEFTLQMPSMQGRLASQGSAPQPFQIRDLLLEANGQWSPEGLHAAVQTLRLQANGLGLARTDLTLAAHLTPQQAELTRLLVRLPKSEIQGHGRLTMADQQLQFRLDIPRLQLDEFPLTLPAHMPTAVQGYVKADGSLKAPHVEVRLRYAGGQILADLAAQLQEHLPRYNANLRLEALDMAQLLPQSQGRLQAKISLQGSGFTEEQRRATLDMSVDTENFTVAPGLTVRLQANVAGPAAKLETFRVRSVPVEMAANGSLSASKRLALTYNLTLGDLTPLQKYLGVELRAKGGLSGEVQGPLNALQARGALRLDQWRYAAFGGRRLQAEFSGTQLPTAPQANFTMQIVGVEGPSLPASSMRLEGKYAAPRGTFDITVTEGPYQKTAVAGNAVLNGGQRLTLSRLRLQHQTLAWENDGPIEIVRNPQGQLQISQLLLRSGSQRIGVQGKLAPAGPVNMAVQVQGLQIRPTVQAVSPNATPPDGQLTLNVNVSGTLPQPQAQGQLQLTSLTWQKRALGDIRGTFDLANMTLRTDLRWQDQSREILRIAGTVGLNPDSALALQVRAPDFDLAMLKPITPAVRESAGKLNLDLQLAGTLRQPQIRGHLDLLNGVLQLAATGERYKDMQIHIIFTGDRVNIERLHVGSRSGPLDLTGRVDTAGTTLRQVDLSIKAQDFTAMHTPNIEAIITSDLRVRGSLQAMHATGTVTVPRARMVLAEIPGAPPKDVQAWELTVTGVYGPGPQAVTAADGGASATQNVPDPLPFLSADVSVNLPRNVWVQAPGTAVEVSGDLKVTKERERPFVLSGSIATVRGFASFYGKKFVLREGQITFTGSPDINPLLDVTVTHKASEYVVSVHVEGKAKQPKLILSSTPELPQADIVSLLVIGKTTDRLTSSEQNALSSQAQQIAGNIVAGQLERALSGTLGLDTVEVTAGDKLGTGSVSVGRYISQDIFLSYERDFGAAGANKVGIEYSLTPRLKLKGSGSDTGESAIDFLWRKDY